MIGAPEETKGEALQTIEFAKSLPLDTIQISGICTYPGTEMYNWAKKTGYLVPNDWRDWVSEDCEQVTLLNYPQLSKKEIDSLIDKGLKEFYNRYQFDVAGTNDFFKTFIDISGKDLGGFFRNWFESYTLPEVKVSRSLEKKEEGGYIMRLQITQLKEPFVFPLWIEWNESGKRVEKRIIINERKKEFAFDLASKPKKNKD